MIKRGGGGLDCTKQPTEYYCTVHMYSVLETFLNFF